MESRIERDSMGQVEVPSEALWGAQTQRAIENFPVSGLTMPPPFIRALGLIKWAAARTNCELGRLSGDVSGAIESAALEVALGRHIEQFPVDVFQTGSGTSSNMNANEVIARLASRAVERPVHPNDHVNMSQSSNDVVPTAIHLSTALELETSLLPALEHLTRAIERKAKKLAVEVKTGRTHLMDAMPIRFDQELGGWAGQIRSNRRRLLDVFQRLSSIAQGGTAVGTGTNAPPGFGARFAAVLSERVGIVFRPAEDYFEAIGSQDTAVELSGQLKTAAVSLMKIANDLRWMNSGPLAGLGEIALSSLQPGSSIMPGKVNPVIPEVVAMVAAQVIGNDATITVAGQSGNFQLNVMLPVVAHNLLQSVGLLAASSRLLADSAIEGFTVNTEHLQRALSRNPILVTALTPLIGYEKGAAIAKQAYDERRPIIDVAIEQTNLTRSELERMLDPVTLTQGGVKE